MPATPVRQVAMASSVGGLPGGCQTVGMANVIVVDDHGTMRSSLARWIDGEVDLTVVGQASAAEDALALLAAGTVDVAVVDVNLGAGVDGFSLARSIRASSPTTGVVIHTMYADDDNERQARESGAAAFVPKAADMPELTTAIRYAAARPDGFVSMSGAGAGAVGDSDGLSWSEVRLLQLLLVHERASDVAAAMNMDAGAVRRNLSAIYRKLGVTTGVGAIREAQARGYLSAR